MARQTALHLEAYNDFAEYFKSAPVDATVELCAPGATDNAVDSVYITVHGVRTVTRQLEGFVKNFPGGARIFPRNDPVSDKPCIVIQVPLALPPPPPPQHHQQSYGRPQAYASSSSSSSSSSNPWSTLKRSVVVMGVVVVAGLLQTSNSWNAVSVLLTGGN